MASARAHMPLLNNGVTSSAFSAVGSKAAGLNESGTAARHSTAASFKSMQARLSPRVLDAA